MKTKEQINRKIERLKKLQKKYVEEYGIDDVVVLRITSEIGALLWARN